MDVKLSDRAEEAVRKLLASGEFGGGPAEVVERAIVLLEDRARFWADLNTSIDEACAEIDAGHWVSPEDAFARARKAIEDRARKP